MTALRRAPYAADPSRSRGRRLPEPPPTSRTEFQRDRDRILHSAAFRRLEYKTQVFVNHEGDMFRTRLTHSLEVAQISRTIARALMLDEDLVEAIALAHDLGHTPFGHAGQDALNACMKPYGGFEHNRQSLRVVDELERRYADFDGLNLTFETREGILKHCNVEAARELGEVGRRFLDRTWPGAEAQLANIADEIAYNNHDVDDSLRAGLITIDQLRDIPLFRECHDAVLRRYPGLEGARARHETIRRMIDAQVTDLLASSRTALDALAPRNIDEVRNAPDRSIRFSEQMRERTLELKRFLRREVYRHPRVRRMTDHAATVITVLFDAYLAERSLIPAGFAVAGADDARTVADYIAGMTDRFALAEYERIATTDGPV